MDILRGIITVGKQFLMHDMYRINRLLLCNSIQPKNYIICLPNVQYIIQINMKLAQPNATLSCNCKHDHEEHLSDDIEIKWG
jgi:hypothetical protein